MEIDGVWKVHYSPVDVRESDEFDDNRAALVILKKGRVEGFDRYGGIYEGSYNQSGETFTANVIVASEDPRAVTIYDSIQVEFPVTVLINTSYSGGDYVVIKGSLETAQGTYSIVGQGKRIALLIP